VIQLKKTTIAAITLLVIVLIAASTFYLINRSNPESYETSIRVVVTILPQAEFVENVGGDKVAVTVLVPPGAEPHTYEPTPSQLKDVARAKLYFKIGSPIEFEVNWLDRVIATNPNMLVIDSGQGIELIPMAEHEHGKHENETAEHEDEHTGMDPHTWTSIRNAKIMVDNIYGGLVQVDPANQDYYLANKNDYIRQLDALDKEITDALAGLENAKFIVYHPSWGYFARDYGLVQISIEEAGKEPTPARLAILIREAKENNVTVIFATPQFSEKSAETVADEIGGKVVLIDPLSKNFLENMQRVAEALAEGMR